MKAFFIHKILDPGIKIISPIPNFDDEKTAAYS